MRAWIRKRRKADRKMSYQVLFRRGGRAFPIECAGTFSSSKIAKTRKTVVEGWLAAGLDPVDELAKLQSPPARRRFTTASAAYLASRVDAAANSRTAIEYAVKFWDRELGGYVDDIDAAAIQAVISGSARSPATLRAYLSTLRGIFDHAGVKPNPAKETLRLPRVDEEEINPPTAAEVESILSRVSKRLRLPLVAAEQCALRIGEVQSLEWGDVDEQGCRFRLRRQTTKRGKARWVPIPAWLMEIIAETCPREDRTPTRRVFAGFNDDTARGAMDAACKLAGIAHYSPHDLRHRRISLWVRDEPIADVAAWVGHAKKSMTLDTYTHVMVGGELEQSCILALLGRAGDDTVMTDSADGVANPLS